METYKLPNGTYGQGRLSIWSPEMGLYVGKGTFRFVLFGVLIQRAFVATYKLLYSPDGMWKGKVFQIGPKSKHIRLYRKLRCLYFLDIAF